MKLTELITHRHEAELLLAAAIVNCRALDECLTELVPVLRDRVGWRFADSQVQSAWTSLVRTIQPCELVLMLVEIERNEATISDVVRAVHATGSTDLAVILKSLNKANGAAANN